MCHSPHHATLVPLILSTQTGIVSPQFHCVFNDNFETVQNEQQDTSMWQKKAHLQKTKETISSALHYHKLATASTQSPCLVFPRYGANIPRTLLHLINTLEPITQSVPTENSTPEPASTEDQAVDLIPQPSEEATQPTYTVNITPTGQTRTRQQICTPSQFGFAAYHCHHLAKSAINSVADFHPLASLQMFVSSISQPKGYLDAIRLHVALQLLDKNNSWM